MTLALTGSTDPRTARRRTSTGRTPTSTLAARTSNRASDRLFPKLGLHTGQQSGPKLLVPQSLSAVHPSSIFGGALTTLATDFGSEVAVAIGSGAADAAAGSRMWQLTTTIGTQSTWRQKNDSSSRRE